MKVQTLSSSMRQRLRLDADTPGVFIVSVDPESDAAEEGLGPPQIITAIDDRPTGSVAEWNRILKDLKPGDTVKVDVVLDGRPQIFFLPVPKSKSSK